MSARVNAIPHEARAFQGRRAGLVTRVASAAIDVGVVAVALLVAYVGLVIVAYLVSPRGFEMPRPPVWLDLGTGTVLATLYLAASWHYGGRTFGSHVMGLRVVDRRGASPGWATALARAVLCVAFPLGMFWVVVSRESRSVQDVLFRTSVIYDWDVRPRSRVVDNTVGLSTGDAPRPLGQGDGQ
jgi:uncharacterized RDD family membrane protein YckC